MLTELCGISPIDTVGFSQVSMQFLCCFIALHYSQALYAPKEEEDLNVNP